MISLCFFKQPPHRHIATNAALSQELVDVVAQREELQTRCSTADSEVTIRMQQYGRAMEEKEHYKQELLKLSQSRSNFLQSANAKNPNNKEVSEQVAREMQAEKAALIAEINTLSMANSQTGLLFFIRVVFLCCFPPSLLVPC